MGQVSFATDADIIISRRSTYTMRSMFIGISPNGFPGFIIYLNCRLDVTAAS